MTFAVACNSQNCKQLPASFKSYNDAISKVTNSNFNYTDIANTSHSSWITSASFYSCDGENGYFIYSTNRDYTYIHKGVPLSIWKAFKTSPSMGSYYDRNIKGKYRLPLQ